LNPQFHKKLYCVIQIIFSILLTCSVAQAECSIQTQALIEKLLYKWFSGGDMAVIEEVFIADIHFEDPMFPAGLDSIKLW
jgi:hypothetical protein